MASWFLIAIASIAAIGIIMLSGVNLINVMASETGQSNTVANFNRVPDLILANSWQASDGNIYLPAAAPAGPGPIEGVGSLPAWLKQNGALATSAQIIYCPFGPSNGPANADVFNPDGTRYQVATTPNGTRSYTTRGRPAYADAASNPNLLGFVMIPDSRAQTYRGCNTITRTGNTYSSAGMLVRPIFLTQATDERLAKSEVRVLYAVRQGTGNGDTASSPASLSVALARWRASTWSHTRIEFNGAHLIGTNELNISGPGYVPKPAGATLTIRGQSRDTSIISMAGTGSLDLPVNLNLSRLEISPTTLIRISPQMKLNAVDVSLGPVQLRQNASAYIELATLRNNGSATLSSLPVFELMSGSKLTLTRAINLTHNFQDRIAIIASGAAMDIDTAVVSFPGSIGTRHTINPGGRMSVRASTLSIPSGNNPTFLNSGYLSITGSTIINSHISMSQPVLNLEAGSATAIQDSVISVPNRSASQRSVAVQNVAHVSGANSSIQGCWQDLLGPPVFALAAQPTNGSRSIITPPEPIPTLSPTPTTGEITLYSEVLQRNSQRATSKQRNSTDWQCVL